MSNFGTTANISMLLRRLAYACSRSSGNCGGCRGFFATFRTYTPWPVHTLELDSATDLPPVRVRPQPNRGDAGFHFEWSRYVGATAATRIESGDCGATVRVESAASLLPR